MTAPVKPTSRDRLLDATAALAYREGVAVGVEALCKAAGVSKRSLYQLFAGKDELLAASLERRAADYSARLLPDPDDGRPPRARVLSVFERAVAQAAVPEYRGCPYLAVQIELKDDDHPASRVARRVKEELAAFFRAEAARGGAADPDLVVRQLMLLFDGAAARAGIHVDTLEDLVVPMAAGVLDAAGVR
ncbi:TetR/AcrR family transcriptional regulator [Streptomyces lasalocidi]|uniref:TetR/AcrR family transcriptional regulator n=1 Tax=Streptomyces lasalocidi TaxID=324833 RepID=A0A4U5WCD5_STRLS|nr:TetR/AcrR family transcriptional regulator [Streptomyces lasalocidi]TKS99436.1 TetR/AcrR family transcriptional regulator [Streptomyces lasalocidi]